MSRVFTKRHDSSARFSLQLTWISPFTRLSQGLFLFIDQLSILTNEWCMNSILSTCRCPVFKAITLCFKCGQDFFLRINWVRETIAWYGVSITWKQLTENIVTNYICKHENTLYFFIGYWHWLCCCCAPKILFPFCHSCPNVSIRCGPACFA